METDTGRLIVEFWRCLPQPAAVLKKLLELSNPQLYGVLVTVVEGGPTDPGLTWTTQMAYECTPGDLRKHTSRIYPGAVKIEISFRKKHTDACSPEPPSTGINVSEGPPTDTPDELFGGARCRVADSPEPPTTEFDILEGPSADMLDSLFGDVYQISLMELWDPALTTRGFVRVYCPNQPEWCTEKYKAFYKKHHDQYNDSYNNFLLISSAQNGRPRITTLRYMVPGWS